MNKKTLEKIYSQCFENKEKLEKVNKCWCFFCKKIFYTKEIKEWISFNDWEIETAFCPFCWIDSIIPESDEYELNENLLKEIHDYLK